MPTPASTSKQSSISIATNAFQCLDSSADQLVCCAFSPSRPRTWIPTIYQMRGSVGNKIVPRASQPSFLLWPTPSNFKSQRPVASSSLGEIESTNPPKRTGEIANTPPCRSSLPRRLLSPLLLRRERCWEIPNWDDSLGRLISFLLRNDFNSARSR
jgi:hypothetical protein